MCGVHSGILDKTYKETCSYLILNLDLVVEGPKLKVYYYFKVQTRPHTHTHQTVVEAGVVVLLKKRTW